MCSILVAKLKANTVHHIWCMYNTNTYNIEPEPEPLRNRVDGGQKLEAYLDILN
jgi:hypothetical protein